MPKLEKETDRQTDRDTETETQDRDIYTETETDFTVPVSVRPLQFLRSSVWTPASTANLLKDDESI